jgi:type 1 glutamine amidotransferase
MAETKMKIKLAVVTGGHSYDVPNFHKLFRSMPKAFDIYIQTVDDFASSPKEVRQAYDVVLFYIMLMDGPKDEGNPWYAGKPLTALSELGETKQGLFVLHHAILAYPQWQVWNEMVGINDRKFGYYVGEKIRVRVTNPKHPIVTGLKDWDMTDETYTMVDAGADSEILLSVDHPKSMKHIAWTRQYRQSRVFNFQSGHDNLTWVDPNFRKVLERGILWSAGAI